MFAVRKLKADEIRMMVLAGEELHHQSAFAHMRYDCARVAKLAFQALDQPSRFFLETITLHNVPVGLLFARLGESYFGPDQIAFDLVFFVIPQFQGRCGSALREIVGNYRDWATENGAKIVNLSCSTQLNAEKTAGLFEHMGFPQTGSLHAVTIH